MKGDFTRFTFDPAKHFSRVLMQQGRVQLDADWNEQTAILLHAFRRFAADLIGPYGGPAGAAGFALSSINNVSGDVAIGPGIYYVDGLRCETEPWVAYNGTVLPGRRYSTQPWTPGAHSLEAGRWIAYLDVWERHVTSLDDQELRESALGGPDTATRAQVVWRIKTLQLEEPPAPAPANPNPAEHLALAVAALAANNTVANRRAARAAFHAVLNLDAPAQMRARLDPDAFDANPCVLPADAAYRGYGNQLYRVEVHAVAEDGSATFKWSADNGSVAAAWLGAGWGPNSQAVSSTRGFEADRWVEFSDTTAELEAAGGKLMRVAAIEDGELVLSQQLAWSNQLVAPVARRWDQRDTQDMQLKDGAVPVVHDTWLDLENGIQVQFPGGGRFRAGDYWLIPARASSGTIEWPTEVGPQGQRVAAAMPPHGVHHHHAPLAVLNVGPGLAIGQIADLRMQFDPLAKP